MCSRNPTVSYLAFMVDRIRLNIARRMIKSSRGLRGHVATYVDTAIPKKERFTLQLYGKL